VKNVALGLVHVQGWQNDRAHKQAVRVLESVGIVDRLDALPHQVSGGQAQRVAIARALALNPSLLLLDEPTAALDPARRGVLGDIVRTLASDSRSLLISTHDVDFARTFADDVAVLGEGRIVEFGRPNDVLSCPSSEVTKRLLSQRPRHELKNAEPID
jgi:ABC-type polar amino acid transport system ATPase subunit